MQVASSRRRNKAQESSALPVMPAGARFFSISEGIIDTARKDYIDALPVAAAILCQDENGRSYVDLANSVFEDTAGWKAASDKPWVDSIGFFSETGISRALEDFLDRGERAYQFEGHDGRSINGRYYTVRLSKLRPTPYAPQRCLIALIDKTVQIETENSLRAEMLRDSLTGLPNRLAFNERVEAILGDRNFKPGSHAVLAVDMTRFSRVNHCVGALAGDELLITFARRLFSALRPGDVLARTGGDEFAILLRLDKGVGDAVAFADRITGVLGTPFRLSDMEIRVDCAIGCAVAQDKKDSAEELLRNAQFALKRAKLFGQVQVYEPGQAQVVRRRFSIETELRRAIEAGQLSLAFQPLVELATGKITGFEALTRWDHEEEGVIAPYEFIEVAEESGLIVPLGRWALGAALDAMRGWDEKYGEPLPVYMGVNLSAVQIQRDDVAALVSDALAERKIESHRLMLEVTESAIIHDPQRATEVLEAMQRLGVRIALDDFGTGYTSLAYLQRLPIDLLKIDSSFVTDMLDDADSTAIVRAVLSVAGALGMVTTAEGVECGKLATALADMGCTNGQGFFFSEPLDADAAFDYWLSRKT
ncbi:MAG TPA: EAL domain-containing protein [Allosphingosinicella sp.]|uniref:putative bifunctional diguanylate cyclase/phosphodiesterase n=1 Tax=Allosphingosinicella sp. TaxID=2823234 RepID=UPI002EDA4828